MALLKKREGNGIFERSPKEKEKKGPKQKPKPQAQKEKAQIPSTLTRRRHLSRIHQPKPSPRVVRRRLLAVTRNPTACRTSPSTSVKAANANSEAISSKPPVTSKPFCHASPSASRRTESQKSRQPARPS